MFFPSLDGVRLIVCRLHAIEQNRPCERTVSKILESNTRQLLVLLERELRIRHAE